MMRRELYQVLRSGNSLDLTKPEGEIVHFTTITVLGSSDDAVRFSLNGMDLTLAGGYTGIYDIKTLSVTEVFAAVGGPGAANCGLLVKGFAQRETMNFL
jgi:hypothetical protein